MLEEFKQMKHLQIKFENKKSNNESFVILIFEVVFYQHKKIRKNS